MVPAETITVCENVCMDFGFWLPSLLSTLGDAATVVAVFIALYAAMEWTKWKKQTVSQSGHEIAKEALLALRSFNNHLNASRVRPGHTGGFSDDDFREVGRLMALATSIRLQLSDKCYLLEELGLNGEVGSAATNLIHLEANISRLLSSARWAHDNGIDEQKWANLDKFFYGSTGAKELDQAIECDTEKLRAILREIAQIKG